MKYKVITHNAYVTKGMLIVERKENKWMYATRRGECARALLRFLCHKIPICGIINDVSKPAERGYKE
jgi:hypothetical protein